MHARMLVRVRVCCCWFRLTLSVVISGALAGELGFCAAERQEKPSAVNVSVWSLQRSSFGSSGVVWVALFFPVSGFMILIRIGGPRGPERQTGGLLSSLRVCVHDLIKHTANGFPECTGPGSTGCQTATQQPHS